MIIGICEDDATFREELRKKIEQRQPPELTFEIYEFSSGEAMRKSMLKFDLVFLDVELGEGETGIVLAGYLQTTLPDVIVVFVSGYTKYVSSAFHLKAFQFLLKPLDETLFQEELERCIHQYRMSHDVFCIPQNGEIIEIEMKDIVYIQSEKRKLLIHDRQGRTYEMYGKIDEQETNLTAHYFIRVHKSYIVNSRYILSIKNDAVSLCGKKNGETIVAPISRRCKSQVKERYQRYRLGVYDP